MTKNCHKSGQSCHTVKVVNLNDQGKITFDRHFSFILKDNHISAVVNTIVCNQCFFSTFTVASIVIVCSSYVRTLFPSSLAFLFSGLLLLELVIKSTCV